METKNKYREHSEVALDDILNSMPEVRKSDGTDAAGDGISNAGADDGGTANAAQIGGLDVISDSDDILVDEDVNRTENTPLSEEDGEVLAEQDAEREYYDEDYDGEYDGGYDDEYDGEYDDGYDENYEGVRYTEQPRKRRKRRRQSGVPKMVFGLLLATIIIGTAIFIAVNIINLSQEVMGLGKSDVMVEVEIPDGSRTLQIAQILYSEGIIEEQWLFILFSRVRGADGSFQPGTHRLMPKMSYGDMVNVLTSAEIAAPRETANVVFPEGISVVEAARRLEESGICDADEFLRVFNSYEFGFDFEERVENTPLKFFRMEGYLFPDTYNFYLDEDPHVVAGRILRNFARRITPDLYGRMDDLGLTLEETLIIASIVQAEVPFERDMRLVASVFWNRLNNPEEYPLLQSDPTRVYVREVIVPNVEIRSSAMEAAYDTYQSAGLPPGPINNPGLAAINAVLFPAETDYYFFCANIETRETFFAKTYAEHNENLVKAGIVVN